jgi:protein phosphatase
LKPLFEQACRATLGARSYQEDFALVWPGATLFGADAVPPPADGRLLAVLADGMGGHAGGAIASRTICETFRRVFADADAVQLSARLVRALDAANAAVRREVDSRPALSGMGATLIGAVLDASGLSWISVGDSPLLLLRRGELLQLNEDHSLAPLLDELARTGELTAEEAESDSRRHLLRSAVTGEEVDLVDLRKEPFPLEPGDTVILASDGIHSLEPDEIARLVGAFSADGVGAIADALIRHIENARLPFQDNATVIVARRAPA